MSLRFDGPQVAALAVFAGLAVFFVLVFLVVALGSIREIPPARVQAVAYAIRRPWLLFLVATVAVTLATLAFFLPYASGSKVATEVRVVGGQFYWSLSETEFTRGERVRFAITSADVNHGFGLYDPDGRLLGSVQAMPGYTNKLTVTLGEPGSYTIACFEFCGLEHHAMIREFSVTP